MLAFASKNYLFVQDEDPYVRKTAAICVAKLHDINAFMVEEQGFLDQLKELLSDSNPMVSSLTGLFGQLKVLITLRRAYNAVTKH